MMNKMSYEEFTSKLKSNFPEMYQDVYCGISIDAGWHQIVYSLSDNIYSHVKANNNRREFLLKDNPYNIKIPDEMEFPTVAQIKEKFGGLRFYLDGPHDDYIEGLITMAESCSYHTCEVCGNPGKARKDGWIKVLCDEHHKEREERYAKT